MIRKSKRKKRVRKFRKGAGGWTPGRSNDEIIEVEDGDSCTYREACNRLRKSWLKFKISKSKDDEISMDEARIEINKMQRALNLPETDFEGFEQGVSDTYNEDQD